MQQLDFCFLLQFFASARLRLKSAAVNLLTDHAVSHIVPCSSGNVGRHQGRVCAGASIKQLASGFPGDIV